MNNDDDNPVISPHHPLLADRAYTVDDCYSMGVATGISPQIIAGIISGRVLPDEATRDFLRPVLGDVIDDVAEDYDPERYMKIYDKPPRGRGFTIDDWYPCKDISPGDLILTRDSRWIEVSALTTYKDRVRLYSGPVMFVDTRDDTYCVAAISSLERTTRGVDSPSREMEKKRIRRMVSQPYDDDIEQRAELFDKIVKEIRG